MATMTCQPITDPGTQPGAEQEPQEASEDEGEPGFISSGKNFLTGVWNKGQSANPLSTDAERQAASDQADKDFEQAGKDIRHAGDRIGNGLTGAGQVVGAGATKLTALAVSPFDKDLSSRFDKAANDAWTDGTGRLKKDGLYTLDVLSNALPGGIAKGAAVLGSKALFAAGGKAAMAKLAQMGVAKAAGTGALKFSSVGGVASVLKGQRGVTATIQEIEAAGGTVLGREVTLRVHTGQQWIKTRPDLYVELPNGSRAFIEVKSGPFARHTRNQRIAYPLIREQGEIPVGKRARYAKFEPGVPIDPTPVWTVWRP